MISTGDKGHALTERGVQLLNGLLLGMQDARDSHVVLETMLQRVVKWMEANRGDFALWDENLQELYVAAINGDRNTGKTKELGEVFPRDSFVRALWDDPEGGCWNSGNVLKENRPYYSSDERTRSEIAIRLESEGKKIAVLNVESFKENAFNQAHSILLGLVAPYASVAVQIARQDGRLWANIKRVLEHSTSLESSLDAILESLFTFYHLTGIIYMAEETKLKLVTAFGSPEVRKEAKGLSYHFDELAAATEVRRSGIPAVINDIYDPNVVNQEGRKLFGITGPLAVLPLKYAEKVVGVLVAWSNEAPFAHKDTVHKLQRFADLAAAKIAMWRTEKELRESETLYHSLVEGLPQNIFRKDLSGRFIFANQRFCHLLGKNLKDIIGMTDYDFYPPEMAAKFQKDDRWVLATGSTFEADEKNLTPKKDNLIVHVVKLPFLDPQNQVLGVQGIFWDITAEKQAQEAREELQRYYDFCLHSFGNELLNFSNALHWVARLSDSYQALDMPVPLEVCKTRKFLKLGLDSVHFYLTHIKKFFRAQLNLLPQPIVPILQEQVQNLHEALEDELQAELSVEDSLQNARICCDTEFTKAMIKELLRNAEKSIFRRREFCGRDEWKGRVLVRVSLAPGDEHIGEEHLSISFIDDGEPCLRPQERARLLQTWTDLCAEKNPNRSQKGLSFVRWVVEKHHGYIALDLAGSDTAFHVHFPWCK